MVERCPTRQAFRFVLLVTAIASGCSTPTTNLNISDGATPTYGARAVIRFGGARGGSGIEVDYGRVSARDHQRLEAGQVVRLGEVSVTGPADLQNEARVQHLHVAFNYLALVDNPVELEWFAGLSALQVDWESQPNDPNQTRLSKRIAWVGPAGGVVSRWKISRHFALEGRLWTALAPTLVDSEKVGYKTSGELAFAVAPVPRVRIRAGYAQSTTRMEHSARESKVAVRPGGTFVGVTFDSTRR
jgi:hypothetical protein